MTVDDSRQQETCTGGGESAYWTQSDVDSGKWIVLPSMRVGRLHHVCEGRPVFVTTAGALVCKHGELSSSICSWISTEQRCTQQGEKPPARNSVCDCENSDGLNWTKEMPRPMVPIDPPESTFTAPTRWVS